MLCYRPTRPRTNRPILKVRYDDVRVATRFLTMLLETGIPFRSSQLQACVQDVLINITLAVEQIAWIQGFVQFQSTLAYLKNPTPAYELPAIDIVGRLDEIAVKAKAGKYHGEYDYEVDIADVFARANDGHFRYLPFLTQGIGYNSNQQVVSLSIDGQELPKIYVMCESVRNVNSRTLRH